MEFYVTFRPGTSPWTKLSKVKTSLGLRSRHILVAGGQTYQVTRVLIWSDWENLHLERNRTYYENTMKLENNRISTRLWSFESLCHSLKAWSELEKGHSGVTKFLPETVNVTWARADSRSTPWHHDHHPGCQPPAKRLYPSIGFVWQQDTPWSHMISTSKSHIHHIQGHTRL